MGLFLAWSGLIFFVMLVPLPGMDLTWPGQLDVLIHLNLYLILGGLTDSIFKNNSKFFSGQVILVVVVLITPEALQHLTSTRTFSPLDLYFNVSGLITGLVLASTFIPIVYLGIGSLVLGGTYAAALFERPLFELVFSSLQGVSSVLFLTNLVLAVIVFALFKRSLLKRLLVGSGGLAYLFVFRVAESDVPAVLTGGVFLLLMVALYLENQEKIEETLMNFVKPLLLILFVLPVIGVGFEQSVFILNAGVIIGVGLMTGTLLAVLVERISPKAGR